MNKIATLEFLDQSLFGHVYICQSTSLAILYTSFKNVFQCVTIPVVFSAFLDTMKSQTGLN